TSPHHLKTRRIGNRYAIEVHIRMDGHQSLYETHDRATAIERRLKAEFGENTHIGIHVEPEE
ncbi:MAG: cation-efflux pump, partial [Bacteroidales bacterium]|nr:cation-efflux pump [Bacteroidales bacterium]